MPFRITLCQLDFCVGDVEGNARRIVEEIRKARSGGTDLIAFPELAVTGYPPEDLLLHPSFISANLKAIERIAAEARGVVAVVGFVDSREDLYNAAAVCADGRIVDTYHKTRLPNYGVFDEMRYFMSGRRAPVYRAGPVTWGVNICEDIWYPDDPTRTQAETLGAQLVVNISASPYHSLKPRDREEMLCTRAKDYSTFLAYCNLVGGQDELVFDGASIVAGPDGRILGRAASFREELLTVEIEPSVAFSRRLHDPRGRQEKRARARPESRLEPVTIELPAPPVRDASPVAANVAPLLPEGDETLEALVLATRDYFAKNGFRKAVIGLSGGIDSSLVACIAAEALGPENVVGVSMPSRFSSEHSKTDAALLAERLGIALLSLPIEPAFAAALESLKPVFGDTPVDVAEENLQARIRGLLLMALSNKFGYLLLATGNKSELSMGYSTLYGDMCGGFLILKDVYKTTVYRIARRFNERRGKEVIPENVFRKPPSAELRPNQTDQDTLPPYEELDAVLRAYIEEDLDAAQIAHRTRIDRDKVRSIVNAVDRMEYKRRQSGPGVKITPRAFGKDRRYPITSRFRV
jgi:NAD+ synthase (glutamine-hydrolysing)